MFLALTLLALLCFIVACYWCAVWVDVKWNVLTKQQILERNYSEWMDKVYGDC